MAEPGKKSIIVGFISSVVIFLTLFWSGLFLLNDPVLRQSITFSLTAHYIATAYLVPLAQQDAFADAERALFANLDPFTGRIDKSDYHHLREELSGEYGGIGISVAARDTLLMIMTVREGGPAHKAGIKSGDFITAVNGRRVSPDNPSRATDDIRGPSGTFVSLTVYRPAIDDTLHMELERGTIRLEHLPYYGLTSDSAAYIRIADFESGTAEDLRQAVREMEILRPAGYIIDLIGNPGGYLHEAIEAADIFLDEGLLVVGTDSRSRWERKKYFSQNDPETDRPVVILTDRGTASAAEIFTGALRGADRAVVVGDTTFGKGLVQSIFGLANEDAIRVTISRYYFADGRFLNPPDSDLAFSGLAPDIVYHPGGELAFQSQVLSGFLIYDFIDSQWDRLQTYPAEFSYPDTVVDLFREFALQKGFAYRSWLTEALEVTLLNQQLEHPSGQAVDQLDRMLRLSLGVDRDVFARHRDFLNFEIHRAAVEKKLGRAASYRNVIVPGRRDIVMAGNILADKAHYRGLLAGGKETE